MQTIPFVAFTARPEEPEYQAKTLPGGPADHSCRSGNSSRIENNCRSRPGPGKTSFSEALHRASRETGQEPLQPGMEKQQGSSPAADQQAADIQTADQQAVGESGNNHQIAANLLAGTQFQEIPGSPGTDTPEAGLIDGDLVLELLPQLGKILQLLGFPVSEAVPGANPLNLKESAGPDLNPDAVATLPAGLGENGAGLIRELNQLLSDILRQLTEAGELPPETKALKLLIQAQLSENTGLPAGEFQSRLLETVTKLVQDSSAQPVQGLSQQVTRQPVDRILFQTEGQPLVKDRPVVEGQTIEESRQVGENQPLPEGQPVREGQPVVERQVVGDSRLIRGNQPAGESRPAEKGQPVIEGRPAGEGQPAEEGQPGIDGQLRAKGPPGSESRPEVKGQPVQGDRLTGAAAEDKQAVKGLSTAKDQVNQAKPSGSHETGENQGRAGGNSAKGLETGVQSGEGQEETAGLKMSVLRPSLPSNAETQNKQSPQPVSRQDENPAYGQPDLVQETVKAPPQPAQPLKMTQVIFGQIAQKAKLIVSPGLTEMQIQLKPEFLGKLNLSISSENGLVTARFSAESYQVKGIIEANLNTLRDALAEQGVKVDQLVVNVGPDHDYSGFRERPVFKDSKFSRGKKDELTDQELGRLSPAGPGSNAVSAYYGSTVDFIA